MQINGTQKVWNSIRLIGFVQSAQADMADNNLKKPESCLARCGAWMCSSDTYPSDHPPFRAALQMTIRLQVIFDRQPRDRG